MLGDMSQTPQTPLQRAVDRVAGVLPTREIARRWYEAYVIGLGSRAVLDTVNQGKAAWVHRRAHGSAMVLALPSVHWGILGMGNRLAEQLAIHDGRQRLEIVYTPDGQILERSLDERFPGRLGELTRVIAAASDGFAASLDFALRQGDEQYGPMRVHYPAPTPGGVLGVGQMGRMGCRRALYDGRVPDSARFVLSDGLEGRAVGWGATLEEAEAAYAAAVARALPEQRHTVETSTDDYDDDGNLLQRGELPPGWDAQGPSGEATSQILMPEPEPDEAEAWKAGRGTDRAQDAEGDAPTHSIILMGETTMRGPSPDAPPLPRRSDCVPHVVIPLEPVLDTPVPQGRWVRLLGETGVTRHALRIEQPDGFLLIGADVLGLVDFGRLHADLDAADARTPRFDYPGRAERERFIRYHGSAYAWSPASGRRPEGLAFSSGGSGGRFEPGGLNGDVLQAQVYRFRRVKRPTD
jgi:hypothetical protein